MSISGRIFEKFKAGPGATPELQGDRGSPGVPPDAAAAELPLIEQINLLHTALFGWPCDALTPLDRYLALGNIRDVALQMLDSPRFRWDIRSSVGLWPHDKWVMAEFRDLAIWVNLADGFVSFGVLHGDWENAEVDFMLSCLAPGDGMIDAGANIGVYSLQAAARVGEAGRVYAFEPMHKSFDMLARSVEANGFAGRCALYNEGLGESEGTGSFHLSAHATNPGSSYVSLGSDGDRIAIRAMDSIRYERPIRFIKIDVEGFEPQILRGARKTLAEHRPVILTELFPRSLREIGGLSGPAYVAMLEEAGYRMRVFSPSEAGEPVTSADAARFDNLSEPINLVCRHAA